MKKRKRLSRQVSIRATLNELSSSAEVVAHIGQDRYQAIKSQDEHPQFIRILVGYEGVSYGQASTDGGLDVTAKRWAGHVVEQLAHKLNFGLPNIYTGNHLDQKNPARPVRGMIMSGHAKEKENAWETEAYGIGYISDNKTRKRIDVGEIDAASVEAEIILQWNENAGVYDVESVESVSAVVLANSEEEKPGFRGAGIVATINELQSVAEDEKEEDLDGNADPQPNPPDTSVQRRTVMADITGKPSDHFNRAQLSQDPFVQTLIRDEVDTLKNQLKDAQKDLEKSTERIAALDKQLTDQKAEAEQAVQELKAKVVERDAQIKTLGSSANLSRIQTFAKNKVDALKVTDKEKETIRRIVETRLKVDDPTIKDEDLEKIVDEAVKAEHQVVETYRSLYGKPADAGNTRKTDDGEDKGDGDGKEAGDDGDANDDPFLAANPLKGAEKKEEK